MRAIGIGIAGLAMLAIWPSDEAQAQSEAKQESRSKTQTDSPKERLERSKSQRELEEFRKAELEVEAIRPNYGSVPKEKLEETNPEIERRLAEKGKADDEAEEKKLAIWRRLAEKDNRRAQEHLGCILLGQAHGWSHGWPVNVDMELRETGLVWLTEAATQGLPYAQRKLGAYLLEESDDKAEKAEGVEWLKKAHKNGDPDALGTLARLLIIEEAMGPKGKAEGKRMLNEADKSENPEALPILADLLTKNKDGVLDPKEKREIEARLQKAGSQGNREALEKLEEWIEAEKAEFEAARESQWRGLAEKGNRFAQESLGKSQVSHRIKHNTPIRESSLDQQEREGLEWLKKAQLQGREPARRDLALLLLMGAGGEGKKAEGESMLRKAGDGGDEKALLELGEWLEQGNGGARRIQEGIAILEKESSGSSKASAEAKWLLALAYTNQAMRKEEAGQKLDKKISIQLFSKIVSLIDAAARGGHYEAQIKRGEMATEGVKAYGAEIVRKDEEQGAYWLSEAHKNPARKPGDDSARDELKYQAENGNEPAKRALESLGLGEKR